MKILVVDDEPLVRLTVRAVLEDCGATVLEAANGVAALTLLEQDRDIDFLFTDIRMPGMNGVELAAAASALRPDLAIALTTGYSEQAPGCYPLLRKPWLSDDLVRLLRQVQAHRRPHGLASCA